MPITKSTTLAQMIHDFVNSDDPKFKNDSAEERKKRAIGAWYGLHGESAILSFKDWSLTESVEESHKILSDFWDKHKEHLHKGASGYFRQDNCGHASSDLQTHIEKHFPNSTKTDKVKTGSYDHVGNPKEGGFIRVDKPQHGRDDLHPSDIAEMKSKGLDHKNPEHRKKFVTEHPDKEKFHWVPHSWVTADSRELTGVYSKHPLRLDPSGFHPSGEGQFDKKIKDKKNAQYKEYHNGKEV